MPELEINQILGIDTRPGHIGENIPALVVGENIDVVSGGAIKSRRAIRKVFALSAQSKGLYARGGVLHAVVPGGQSLQDTAPPNFLYDGIGNGSAYPLSVIDLVVSADTYDVDPIYGPNGFLAIQLTNGTIEYHWVKAPPASSATALSTQIAPGFTPGASLIKLKNKMVGIEPSQGNVPFSSSVNGPDDWTTAGDAGFLPVSSHVSGNRVTKGVSHHRSKLAVLFDDAIQLWDFDEDPNNHALAQVFNGPGAMLYGSVVNVLGDMIYLSRGGFRNLSTATVTGESNENEQLGTCIKTLTDLITDDERAVALWSQATSQYLCAIGTTVYALTYLVSENLMAWTTWELPVAVDYMVELDGVLYIRSDDDVYQFTDEFETDEGGVAITATVRTRNWSLGKGGRTNELMWLAYRQTGEASWKAIIDGVDMAARTYRSSPDTMRRVPIAGQGRQVAFEITATSAWRLDGFIVEYEKLGV